jgi:serine protease inhibitor
MRKLCVALALLLMLTACSPDGRSPSGDLPKFDFDTSVEFAGGSHPEFDALFAVGGMNGALSENTESGPLLISKVIHKTTFTLEEVGIEASAATVVEIYPHAPAGERGATCSVICV